jgi:hypothetical protein
MEVGMSVRTFALIIGIAFTAAGILGFIPALVTEPPAGAPDLAVDAGHGRLLGLFPVNALHNVVHLAIGVLGLLAYRRASSAIAYSRGLAIFYGALALLGLIPAANTLFGLVPIYSHDIWLHAATALAGVYFGWGVRAAARDERRRGVERRTRAEPVGLERRAGLERRHTAYAGG